MNCRQLVVEGNIDISAEEDRLLTDYQNTMMLISANS